MTEQTETTVEAAPQKTVEQQFNEMAIVAKSRHKALSQLTRAHVADYLHTLAFAPKVSGNEKADLILKFVDMLEGVLDFGVNATGAKVPGNGSAGKRVSVIGGILAQALDNRMLLLAQKMQDDEAKTETEVTTDENPAQ